MRENRRRDIIAITVLAALSLLIMGRQFFPLAVFSCQVEDTVYYLNWIRQFADALSGGILYPRWMPDSHGGYGNPTFMFYSPLGIYLAALLKILFRDIILAMNLVKLIELFLSGVFMYLFARELWGRNAGLAAGVVYIVLPYRVFELYCMGLHASKLAYVWFPVILYFTSRAVKEERIGAGTAMLSLSYALLCLTHILSAYMFAPVLLSYGLYSAGRGRFGKAALRLSLAGFLGLSLTAFYLVPALFERPMVHFEMLTQYKSLQYWNKYLFLLPGEAEQQAVTYASYLKGTVIFSCLLGLSVYLLSNILVRLKEKSGASFFLAVCAGALFMMSSVSGFLWATIPGINLLQFPARLSSVLAFSLSALAGASVWIIKEKGISARRVFISVWGILFVISVFFAVKENIEIISRSCIITREDVARFPIDKDVSEYVPKTVSLEWLEGELKKTPAGEVVPLAGNTADIRVERWDAENRAFDVSSIQDAVLRIRTFYYPGWHGYLDGRPVELSGERTSGAMLLTVPAGVHRVMLKFSDTPDRVWGKILSALAAVIVLFIFVRSGINPAKMTA